MPNYRQLFTDAERQQAIADQLASRAMQPRAPAQQGRITPVMGAGEGLSQLGEALLARRANKKAAATTTQAEEAKRQAQAEALKGLAAPGQDFGAAQQAIDAGIDPNLVGSYMQSRGPQKPVEVGYGGQLVDPQTGKVLASNERNPADTTSGVPGSLQELAAINADRAARGEPPMKPEEYLAQRRGSSADSQLYAQYVQGLPEGVRPLPMDQFLIQFRSGASGAQAQSTQIGETRGAAIANLPTIRSSTRAALETAQKILQHPGLGTATGLSGTIDPRNYVPGTEARGFKALLNQAQGQVFLDAFQALKGGGAITEVEGLKAEQAKARLDTAQSDEEFRSALNDYTNALRRGLALAEERAGQAQPLPPATAPSQLPSNGGRGFRYDPATGQFEPM